MSKGNSDDKSKKGKKSRMRVSLAKKYSTTTPEEALWKAVILQAFEDLKIKSKKKSKKKFQLDALKWILEEKVEFNEVCNMANVPPNKVKNFYETNSEKANNKDKKLE
jgi:hypothetical protein